MPGHFYFETNYWPEPGVIFRGELKPVRYKPTASASLKVSAESSFAFGYGLVRPTIRINVGLPFCGSGNFVCVYSQKLHENSLCSVDVISVEVSEDRIAATMTLVLKLSCYEGVINSSFELSEYYFLVKKLVYKFCKSCA